MNLLLDLGNTRLKWAFAEHAGQVRSEALAWDTPDFVAALEAAWRNRPDPQGIYLACVAADACRQRVVSVLQARFGQPIRHVVATASACGVHSAYPEPGRLGVDRFLTLIAAHDAGLAPCILAGCGTALTLDALAAGGRHLGGWIAPGAGLMQTALLDATAKVRPERAGRVVDAADNTADAVVSGCWHAAAALVERFAARLASHLGGNPLVVLGGGDADRLAPLLSLPTRPETDLVLRGLAVWAAAQATDRRAIE